MWYQSLTLQVEPLARARRSSASKVRPGRAYRLTTRRACVEGDGDTPQVVQ